MVGAEVGEGATHVGKTSISGGGEKYNYFLSASTYERNAYPLSDDYDGAEYESGDYRENSDKENSAFFANYGYNFSKNFSGALTFNYLLGEYGIPIPSEAVDTDGDGDIDDFFAPTKKYERMDDFEGFSFQIAADYHPQDSSFSMRGWAFYNQMDEEHNRYCDNRYDSFTCDPLNITFNLDDTATVKGLSLQPKYFFGDTGMLTLALSGELDSWESDGQAWNVWSSGWPPGYVVQNVDKEKDVGICSASLEYEYSPLPKLGLVFGWGNHYQNRDDISENEILVNPNLINVSPDESDYAYSLLFGTHYDVSKNTRLKAAIQRNIRFPSIRQLYDEDSGNPALQAERVYHYTAGVERKLPRSIRLTLDVFHSIARNFIEKDNRRSELFENFDKYLFTGAELTADVRTFKRLMLRASYSLLHATDESDFAQESDERDELPYRPEHRISVETKYDFVSGFTPYLSILYVINQVYYTRGGIRVNPENGSWENNSNYPPKQDDLDDYLVLNLKLNQKVCRDTVTLYLGVDNILDEDYEQSYGYPLAGRVIYSGVEVRF